MREAAAKRPVRISPGLAESKSCRDARQWQLRKSAQSNAVGQGTQCEVNKVRAVPKGLANTSQAKRKAEGLGYDDDGSQSTEAS